MALSPIDPTELKFLLRLLESPPNYRNRIGKLQPNSKTKPADRNKACESLCSKGLVAYEKEIKRYRTTPAGKNLLKQDTSRLPVTSDEIQLLKVGETKEATPGEARKVPADRRQSLLHQLEERGLISVNERNRSIREAWLTPQGKKFLRDDCTPAGPAPLPFSMLSTYLTFLRQALGQPGEASDQPESPLTLPPTLTLERVTPEAVLETIQQLDQQLGTDNYLPIFHLREKLQPPLSRESLDQMLYDLQRRDRIDFSTLQDVSIYSETQIEAGISQEIGGSLFYISVM